MSNHAEQFRQIIETNWGGPALPEVGEADQAPIYIPERLDLAERPELAAFPANILFGSPEIDENGYSRISTYVPAIESYILHPLAERLRYVNRLGQDKRDYIDISVWYDAAGQFYEAQRFVQLQPQAQAYGSDWEGFFSNLTAQGIIDGEKFEIQKLTEQTSGGVH